MTLSGLAAGSRAVTSATFSLGWIGEGWAEPKFLLPFIVGGLAALTVVWAERRRLARLGVILQAFHASPPSVAQRLRGGLMLVAAVALTGALVFAARARQRAYVTAGAEEVPLRVLLAVDLSPSMTVEDVPPSRFIQARLAANRLLPEVPEADVGLLVFGGYAALVVPPTPDRRLLRDYLEALRPDERAGDTDLASAIRAGTGALVGGRIPGHEGRPSSRSWLVLFTDGEGFEEEAARLKAIELASEKGVRVAVVTLGTPEGGALPGKPNVRSRAFPNRFRGLPGSGAPPPKAVFAIARQIQEEDAHGGPSASPLDRVEGRDPLGRLLAVAALLALAGEWMMGLRGRVPI